VSVDQVEDTQIDDDLGDIASGTLEGVEVQEMLDGTDMVKIKFVGMSTDVVEDTMKIGDEEFFLVRARCVGVGSEEMADGHVRQFRKMRVESVKIKE